MTSRPPEHEIHLPKDLGELAHLLLDWPIRQAPRLALPACILLAAIVQSIIIILFSISYKTPSDTLPFSPQIYFLPTDSAAARKIAPWLEANDPSVFSPQYATRDALPAPPPLTYRPSYEEPPPPLLPLPREVSLIVEPPALPLMTGILKNHPLGFKTSAASSPSSPEITTPQTLVRWQDALAARVPRTPAGSAASVPQTRNTSAQPSLYEVEISAEGIPLHCVLLDSSGDPASDEAGNVWIHMQRFLPADQASWGRVLILWGTASSATPSSSPLIQPAPVSRP